MAHSSRSGAFRASHQLIISLGLIYIVFFGALPLGAQTLSGRNGATSPAREGVTPRPPVPPPVQPTVAPPAPTHESIGATEPAQRGARSGASKRPVEPAMPAPQQSNLPCSDCYEPCENCWTPPGDDPYLVTSRTQRQNETGQQGVDLGSRNYNWSQPLVNLPGRAGMDLGLTLFYNSLVWVKQSGGIMFNPDKGFPGAGFQLGLPRIEPPSTGIGSILVMPNGGRIHLQYAPELSGYPTSEFSGWKSGDSEYFKAAIRNDGGGVAEFYVWTPDGTRLDFTPQYINGSNRCTRITDRNGNFISATYNQTNGHLNTLTDTVGRVVSLNYDEFDNLSTITQNKRDNSGAIEYAHFYYEAKSLVHNFGSLYVNKPADGTFTALTKVALLDGSYVTFAYNPYGQVKQFTRYGDGTGQNNELSYLAYNVPDDTAVVQSDCPRFTQESLRVTGWNNNQPAVTSYSVDSASAGGNQPAWTEVTTPDGTKYKEFFDTSNTWKKGLSTKTELRDASGVRRRWTETVWTQDNPNLTYPQNPRVSETKTYDDANGDWIPDNTRRTTISYNVYNNQTTNLPYEVREYAPDGSVYRTTRTGYVFDAAYINRNIWGLIAERKVFAGDSNGGALVARTIYEYDWAWDHLQSPPAGVAYIPGHDPAYDTNYRVGRGNLTFVWRRDATDPDNGSKGSEFKIGFDTLGNTRFTRDPEGHTTEYFYEDRTAAGYAGGGTQALAYPTSTLGAWQSNQGGQARAYTGYNYDTGQVTKTEGIAPTGKTRGAVQLFYYDTAYRLQKQLLDNTQAYTSYVYAPTLDKVTTYTKREGGGEIMSETRTDGAGRTLSVKSEHPNSVGDTNRFMGQQFVYDVMGRAWKTSHPAEVNAAGTPGGDDADWYWTEQAYDYKGRPTATTNPDGTQKLVTYEGCGCAGGAVTTVRDEAGRRKRYTDDFLGRMVKVEELDWQQNVYSTTLNSYNPLDQLTEIRQNAGATTGDPNARVRSFLYDGHGRLVTKITPEQGATTYQYDKNDALHQTTDARGVVTSYNYYWGTNTLHDITRSAPAGVAGTPLTTFYYDAAENLLQWVEDG